MTTPRLFTVALPLFNGGSYFKECVNSVLGQTFDDFELVVLDSGSSDGSVEWLHGLSDPRVTLLTAERPRGIEENWARILGLPKGEFLTIIGQDDLFDPEFLATVRELTSEHPDANLYLTHFRLINENGDPLRPCLPMPARETAAEFLAARLCSIRDSYGTGYVVRSRHYDQVGGIPSYRRLLYADDALWLKIIGTGYRATAPGECFAYRLHGGSTSGAASPEDLLAGLVAYWDLLEEFGRGNAAVAAVRERYGQDYLRHVGRVWHRQVLAARVMSSEQTAFPAFDRELRTLLARSGLSEADVQPPGNRELQLLAWAARSRPGRSLYRLREGWRRGRTWLRSRVADAVGAWLQG